MDIKTITQRQPFFYNSAHNKEPLEKIIHTHLSFCPTARTPTLSDNIPSTNFLSGLIYPSYKRNNIPKLVPRSAVTVESSDTYRVTSTTASGSSTGADQSSRFVRMDIHIVHNHDFHHLLDSDPCTSHPIVSINAVAQPFIIP